MNKSEVFTNYNIFKSTTNLVDERTNRALGYLQSNDLKSKLSKYNTTLTHCECPDRVRPCKHIRARQMEMSNCKYFLIRFWAQTYSPEKLIEPGIDLFMDVARIVFDHVEVSTDGKNWRKAKTSNLEVFETLAYDETYQYSWTALTKTRNSRAGWNGLFQMAFKINS